MLGPFPGLLFVVLWLVHEVAGRKALGREPSTFKELWRSSQKKHASDPRVPAAIFAVGSAFIFALWESILRWLLGQKADVWFFVAGLAVAGFALYVRRKHLKNPASGLLHREDVIALWMAVTLLWKAYCSVALLPWILYRTRFLPSWDASEGEEDSGGADA